MESNIELVVQVNGKLRGKIHVAADISKDDAISAAKEEEHVRETIVGKNLVKEIYVPGKLVNLVVK